MNIKSINNVLLLFKINKLIMVFVHVRLVQLETIHKYMQGPRFNPEKS